MNVSGVPLFFKMFIVFAASGVEYLNNGSEAADECAFGGQCAYCNASYCYTCKTGFFGTFCEKECGNCPPDTACERVNGLCKDGCKDGSSGHYCNVSCDGRCQSCDIRNAADCVQCKNNQRCVLACPSVCQGHSCNSNGSYCNKGCKPGSWGQRCEKDCLVNCSRVGCNRENGTCPEVSSETERPTCTSAFEVVVSVLSVLLVVMVGVVIFTLFLKRKQHRQQRPTLPSERYDATMEEIHLSGGCFQDAAKVSETSERCKVTSRTGKSQDNAGQFSGNNDPTCHFVTETAYTTLSKNNSEHQYSPITKIPYTTERSGEIKYENTRGVEHQSSDIASDYITPLL